MLIAAIHERLRNMLPVLKDNRAAQSNVAKPPDAAAPSVNEEVAAEIKKARQLEQIAEQAAASEPFPEQADRTIVTFECKPDAPLRVEIGGFKVSVGESTSKLMSVVRRGRLMRPSQATGASRSECKANSFSKRCSRIPRRGILKSSSARDR